MNRKGKEIIINNWKDTIKFNPKPPKPPPKTFWDKFQSILNIILN